MLKKIHNFLIILLCSVMFSACFDAVDPAPPVEEKVADPFFTPADGVVVDKPITTNTGSKSNYTTISPVSIESNTANAEIYYTFDKDTDPVKPANSSQTTKAVSSSIIYPTGSILYTGPFSIDKDIVIKARAYKDALKPSDVIRKVFIYKKHFITDPTTGEPAKDPITGEDIPDDYEEPTFAPVAGVYEGSISVTINNPNIEGTIRYTIDGSEPGPDSPIANVGTPIQPDPITTTTTVKARVFGLNKNTSDVATATYTIKAPVAPVANPILLLADGEYRSNQTLKITCATPEAEIRFTRDGVTEPNQSNSEIYDDSTGILIDKSQTIKVKAFKAGYNPSAVVTGTYKIYKVDTTLPKTTLPNNAYLGQTLYPSSKAKLCEELLFTESETGAVFFYTLDGTDPATSATAIKGTYANIDLDANTVTPISNGVLNPSESYPVKTDTLKIRAIVEGKTWSDIKTISVKKQLIPDSHVIYFPCTDLKNAVKTALIALKNRNIGNYTTGDVTYANVKDLTSLENATWTYFTNPTGLTGALYSKQICSLNGLQYFTSLETLELAHNSLKAADLNYIKNLYRVNYLNLSGNKLITNLSGISNMTNITRLGLSDIEITDVQTNYLTNLVLLEELRIVDRHGQGIARVNKISNLDFLNNKKYFRALDMSYSYLSSGVDFGGLANNIDFINNTAARSIDLSFIYTTVDRINDKGQTVSYYTLTTKQFDELQKLKTANVTIKGLDFTISVILTDTIPEKIVKFN